VLQGSRACEGAAMEKETTCKQMTENPTGEASRSRNTLLRRPNLLQICMCPVRRGWCHSHNISSSSSSRDALMVGVRLSESDVCDACWHRRQQLMTMSAWITSTAFSHHAIGPSSWHISMVIRTSFVISSVVIRNCKVSIGRSDCMCVRLCVCMYNSRFISGCT